MGGTLDHRLAGTALAYEMPLCRYMAQPGRIICNVFFKRITRGGKESAARATVESPDTTHHSMTLYKKGGCVSGGGFFHSSPRLSWSGRWGGDGRWSAKKGSIFLCAKRQSSAQWSTRRPRRPHPLGTSGSSTLHPSGIAFAPDGPGPTRRPTRSSSTPEAHSHPVVWHGAQTGPPRSPALRPRDTRSPTVSS